MKNIYVLFLLCLIANRMDAQTPAQLERMSDSDLTKLYEESRDANDMDKALNAVSLLVKRQEGNEDAGYFRNIRGKVEVLRLLAKYDEAKELATTSLKLVSNLDIDPHIGYQFKNELGALMLKQHDLDQALAHYMPLVSEAKEVLGKKDINYIQILFNAGLTNYKKGDINTAVQLYLEGVEVLKGQKKERYSYVKGIRLLANCYSRQQKMDLAESLFLEALDICEKGAENGSILHGDVLNDMAILKARTRKMKEADLYFLKNIELQTKFYGSNHPETIKIILNRVSLLILMNKYQEAKIALTKIDQEKIIKNENSISLLIRINERLSIINTELGHLEKAEVLFKKTLLLSKELYGKEHYKYAGKLQNYLMFKLTQDTLYQYDELLGEILDAISPDLNGPISMDEKLISSLNKIEVYHENTFIRILKYWVEEDLYKQRRTGNVFFLERRIEVLNVILSRLYKSRQRMTSRKDQLRILKESQDIGASLVTDLYKLHEETKETTYLNNALIVMEQSKSILLSDALRGEQARSMGSLPTALADEELRLKKAHAELKKAMLQLREDTEIQTKRKELNSLNQEIENFQSKLAVDFPNYFEFKYAKDIFEIENGRKLLREGEAILEYYLTKDYFYVIYIDQKEAAFFKLEVEMEEMKEQVEKLRKALSDYMFIQKTPKRSYELYIKTAYWMYSHCLQPILKDKISIKRLNIIADGVLSHVPFEAFLTEEISMNNVIPYSEMPYLLKEYEIRYNYSASLLRDNKLNGNRAGNTRMLGMAANYTKDAADLSQELNRVEDFIELRKLLNDLPAARKEVETLSNLVDGDYFYDEDANEKTFKSKASSYGIIHLAMHGVLDKKHPLLSSMAFTENGAQDEDNFLQAYEISNLDLNQSHLVVLSACETGYGKFEHGEGVMSLARSFMYAGAPALLVSLWQVNDASTAMIMEAYYKELKMGLDKATALQKAKLSYLSTANEVAAHPAFWAPFIQLGNTQPIFTSSKISMWLGGLGLGLILIGIVWFKKRKQEI